MKFNAKSTTFFVMRQYDCTGCCKKNGYQFYFWDNFGNSAPILTILSLLQAEIYDVTMTSQGTTANK